jgi:two-component system sensor histidine kinase RegB
MFFYRPLPHVHIKHGADFNLHVLGMWFGFLLSAGLIIFFVVRMAKSLRERDRILTEAREQALRDQHLVALGTLATGAAHELGTPLATMAVLASELKYEYATDTDVVEKADMLRGQLDRCKSILSDITASAGQARPEGGSSFAIDDYLETVVELLQSSRPAAQISCQLNGSQPPPQILADKTLTQALLNILNNAADASIDNIEVEGHWDGECLTITILDRGEGLSPAVQAAAGTPFFTTKPDGQGLGLYLARAVMERFGGQVQLFNRKSGGAQAVIELPLSTIGVPS